MSKFIAWQHELNVMHRVKGHSNVVQLIGYTVNPLQMVMEFCPFGDLYHFMKNFHTLDWRFTFTILKGVAAYVNVFRFSLQLVANFSGVVYKDCILKNHRSFTVT